MASSNGRNEAGPGMGSDVSSGAAGVGFFDNQRKNRIMIQIAKIMTTAQMRIVVVIPEGEAAG